MVQDLTPYGENVLVLLGEQYEHIALPDKKYDTKTSGVVVSAPEHANELVGCTAYFEAYKDDVRVEINGNTFAFINLKDIRGYLDEQPKS